MKSDRLLSSGLWRQYDLPMELALHDAGFCRDCFASVGADATRCPSCKGPRLVKHPELHQLAITHLDCDAFYAAVEKRDNPELADRPVIVGGATRGVVSTACYIARVKGVKSAMPMFKALKLCPEAVVVKPNMRKYAEVGKAVRQLMLEVTPLVQPISIDEAFLDLSGTSRLHGTSPAITVAKLERRIETELGVSASIGLSHNKFLAKLASDFQKPKGYSVIGKAETLGVLAAKPVSAIWGVGKATQVQLAKRGISMISQLQHMEKTELTRHYGSLGARLYHLSRGQDTRDVETDEETKSVSAETTFDHDMSERSELEAKLWNLSQRVSRRAKTSQLAGTTVTLKLKTPDFQSRTRATSLATPTNLAHVIFDLARALLRREADGRSFRLIGVGISNLSDSDVLQSESLDARQSALTKAETAMDKIRQKFGNSAVDRGISLEDKTL